MPDPFLLAHSVGPGLFEISGLRPISIRDQMVRGRMLVERATAEGLLGPHRRLLVIGAGAGGVSAAITAAQRGVRTLLVERTRGPFVRQQSCTRHIDPTIYDWPASHWDRGHYPWTPPPMPLPWRAGSARALALRWTHLLFTWRRRSMFRRFLNIRYDQPVLPDEVFSRGTSVVYAPPNAPAQYFGAAISCVGFGSERSSVAQYRGYDFWSDDPYDHPDLELPPGTSVSALVSGGGDGALQDFIRILTTEPIQVVFKIVEAHVHLDQVREIEDRYQRACVWSAQRGDSHRVLDDWHRALDDVAERAWLSLRRGTSIGGIKAVLRHGIRIKLVHPCTHFTYCYAANRVLALVLARAHAHFEKIPLDEVLLHGNGVVDVAPTPPHSHPASPDDCHGRDHEVFIEPRSCGSPTSPRGSGSTRNSLGMGFNVVVVRHGIVRKPLFGDAPMIRQYLPYHAFQ